MLITPLSVYGFIKYKLFSLEKEVYTHLLQKYDKNDIFETKPKLGIGHLFVVTVKFEDDNIIYEYTKKNDQIIQVDPEPSISNYKHTEK